MTTTMQAMWPLHQWHDGEFDRLIEHLKHHEFQDVMATLGVLERTSRHWPHWSEMSDVLMSIMRRRREAVEVESELGDPPVSAERAREYIAECRAIVAGWNPQAPLRQALERGWS